LRLFLKRLAGNRAATKPLRAYVEINPPIDISRLSSDSPVSFVPMDAVEDSATGCVRLQSRPLAEVQKGYTPFAEGDVLWAKITPCMQNGKSCIARGLQNGIGFGSTEFHVFRVRDSEVSAEFVWEFLSQESLRRVATFAFTGSAGHQRVPDTFLAELPFPKLSPGKQSELGKL
jgi:type I restriction enzyme S subunit